MPLSTLENVNVLDNFTYMQERSELDVASVGYYKTVLGNGVTAELTASAHAGIILYNYSPNATERHILVDVSHMLPSSGEAQHSQFYANGFLERSPDGSKYQGYGVYRGGFSSRKSYCNPISSFSIMKTEVGSVQDPMHQFTSAPSSISFQRKFSSSQVSTLTHTGQTVRYFARRFSQMPLPSLAEKAGTAMQIESGDFLLSRATPQL